MILIVIPIGLILPVAYLISSYTLRSKIDRNENLALNQLNANINYKMNQIKVLAGGIIVNKNIISALREYSYSLNRSDGDLLLSASDTMHSFFVTNNAVRTIYIRNNTGREFIFGTQETTVRDGHSFSDLIADNPDADSGRWIVDSYRDIFLIYIVSVKDYYKGNVTIGNLIIYLNRFIFSDVFDSIPPHETAMYFILGKDNEYIYGTAREDYKVDFRGINPPSSFDKYEITSFGGNRHVVVQQPIDGTDWRLVSVTPLSVYFSDLHYLQLTIGLAAILSLGLTIVMNIRFSKILSGPVNKLVGDMSRLQSGLSMGGYFDQKEAEYRDDELGYIQRCFDEMAAEIRQLISKVYQHEEAKRIAELDALQAQINPHFLYNTLNSINCLARLNNQKDISDIVVNLGILLRNSFDSKKELIPVSEEIEYLKRYLHIANIRWDNRFEMLCFLPEASESYLIPKMTLQPLVENCITHGFNEIPGIGRISVSVEDKDDDITIKICDNGKGLDKEGILNINRALEDQKSNFLLNHDNTKTSIGIYNVNARLFLYYGEKYGLTFYTNAGSGITVQMLLPKRLKSAGTKEYA
jgi:two-component system sensor histidine kinase YesM